VLVALLEQLQMQQQILVVVQVAVHLMHQHLQIMDQETVDLVSL
jgi:hypothetical protein